VFGVGNQEDYERISEAAWGVANAFVGSSLHAGHELVACPECGYEGSVDQAVFPEGTDHHSSSGAGEGQEDSEGEYEKTGEWEGHDVVEWTGEEESYEYWECDDCYCSPDQ